MPYPNEHACRLRQPRSGAPTRRKNGDRSHDGKSYDVIYQEQANGSWAEQAYRYPKGSWDASSASSHCSSHGGSFEAARAEKEASVRLIKALDEKQIVYGIALAPDDVDAHNEYVEKEDIEDAAHEYMMRLQRGKGSRIKLSHQIEADQYIDIVESYLAPADFQVGDQLVKEGTWIVAMKVHDPALWGYVKEEFTGFSVGGYKQFT